MGHASYTDFRTLPKGSLCCRSATLGGWARQGPRGGQVPLSLSRALSRPMPIPGSSHHLRLQSRTKISLLEYRSRWGGNGATIPRPDGPGAYAIHLKKVGWDGRIPCQQTIDACYQKSIDKTAGCNIQMLRGSVPKGDGGACKIYGY